MSKNSYTGIHPYVVNQVRYHGRTLIKHPIIHGVDLEDIEQELILDYWIRKHNFDPNKAKWSTFIDRILKHKCASLLEVARAQKRGSGVAPKSLTEHLESSPDLAHKNQLNPDLQLDLEKASKKMPSHLILLMVDLQTLSISEISQKTKTPRSTLYGTLSKLRESLMRCGFAEYFY